MCAAGLTTVRPSSSWQLVFQSSAVAVNVWELLHLGGHGLENLDELFYRVQELVFVCCPRLTEQADLLEFMWFEICRPDLRKFSFCSNWPADIVNGKISRELQARALEIPSIRRDVRKVFFCVPLLMRVCSDREEIEVKTEWELENNNQAPIRSVGGDTGSDGTRADGTVDECSLVWRCGVSQLRRDLQHKSCIQLPRKMSILWTV
ncbi:hypothetical protein PsorP6_002999 [Peronosclerospora sorghi]|uniref:Uncharacterized protein n=1 Tax=Peronosclerospora sorghi TaxID=230839 RepID=A0ACC0VRZ6_9STRA|nr:hypothetical protein PsorP6_002999 [Peronosclerospora sorghi]